MGYEYDYNYEKEYDIDIIYQRSITRFLDLFMGMNLERDAPHKKAERTSIIGFKYVLPLLLESKLQFNSEKDFEFFSNNDAISSNDLFKIFEAQ